MALMSNALKTIPEALSAKTHKCLSREVKYSTEESQQDFH